MLRSGESQATKKSNAAAAADAAAFLTEAYTFSQGKSSTQTSGQIKSLIITAPGYSTAYSYTYDANGNITKITRGKTVAEYTYDSCLGVCGG